MHKINMKISLKIKENRKENRKNCVLRFLQYMRKKN